MENDRLDTVEKLVSKTGASYADAKAALERTNWDPLDAIILLEREGKLEGRSAAYSTAQPEQQNESAENFKQSARSFGEWVKNLIDKGNANYLEMHRHGERVLTLPVTVFVLLLLICFWAVVPAMIIALFFGCRFSFNGPDLGREKVNRAMGKATDIADDIKNEFRDSNNGAE